MIILDTDVLSELIKPKPAEAVVDWVAQRPPIEIYITAITQAEILYGVRLLPDGKRRKRIEHALNRVQELIEATGARSLLPLLHEARAELAAAEGDDATRERELREAHRLFLEMGATGRAHRFAQELGL